MSQEYERILLPKELYDVQIFVDPLKIFDRCGLLRDGQFHESSSATWRWAQFYHQWSLDIPWFRVGDPGDPSESSCYAIVIPQFFLQWGTTDGGTAVRHAA